jgi:hypothetical protein
MEASLVIHRIVDIAFAVCGHPLVYLPMIGAWLITEMYFIINCDEAHGHTYVMSTGIALIFTAFMISPLSAQSVSWSLLQLRTLVVLALFFYGLFLVVFGIKKAFPGLLAEFFGDPGHSLVPGMMAILYIEEDIPFDWLTFWVVVAPVMTLGTVKTYRRLVYRLARRAQRD